MKSDGEKMIAFFLPGLYGGGAERILLNLAEGLTQRGVKVDLVLAQLEGSFLDQVPTQIQVVSLRKKNRTIFRTLACIPALIRYLKNQKPDTLLTALHGNLIAIWAKYLARSSTKLVITEHNTFSLQNNLLPWGIRWLNRYFVHFFYPSADEIVAVSHGVADDLADTAAIDKNRIIVIYNPIVNSELKRKALEPLTHPWFAEGSPPVIISIGRLTEQKDFSSLIQAFHTVRKVKNAKLLILGEGEKRELLTALIEKLGLQQDVLMPGFVSNPYNYLAHSAMFVLSSKWEGLPTVLVEAMACGIPVISTNCRSGPKEILKDGMYGKLVPVGDLDALSGAMIDGLNGKIPPPPEESWKDFTVEKTVDKYLEILFDHS